MPIVRRTDGFHDDGSYSVASDFDKQIGQALAEQEARLRSPRFIPGARVENPDAPEILREELIEPVLTAFGMPTGRAVQTARAPQTRLFETGGNIIKVDPATGQAVPVYTAPARPAVEPKYEVPTGLDVLGKPTTTARLTLPEMEQMAPMIEDRLRTNAPWSTYLGMARNRQTNTQSGPVRPGQRGRLTRELAAQFKEQARGDKELARKLAREAGYDF